MTMVKASPLSNMTICALAKQFRNILGISESSPIDICAVLEIAMPLLDSNFNYSVRYCEDMAIDAHAYTNQDENEIVILDEIYDRAVAGLGRDRMTIAHELGHYLLHNKQMGMLTRVYDNEQIKTFEDPEWQATAFAGELLCPAEFTKGLSADEIAEKYGVSLDAAKTQKRKGERL